METLISMTDTPETLELYEESQAAIKEAQVIGNRALGEDNTSQPHLHQSIAACTKHTMDTRRDLVDHTPPLHIGSKIRLHGLTNQALNGKKGTVLGTPTTGSESNYRGSSDKSVSKSSTYVIGTTLHRTASRL